MKSGVRVLLPRTLSPTVNTAPGMVSRMAAVASSYGRSQRAISPAPTSTCPDVAAFKAASPRTGRATGPTTDRSPVQVHSSPIATRTAKAGMTRKRLGLRRLGDIEASVACRREGTRLEEQELCAGVFDLTPSSILGCGIGPRACPTTCCVPSTPSPEACYGRVREAGGPPGRSLVVRDRRHRL